MSGTLIASVIGGACVAAALLAPCFLPTLGILQQVNYSGGGFLRWCFQKKNMLVKRLALLSLCLFLAVALFDLCFAFLGTQFANLISVVPFFVLCAVYIFASKRFALKIKAKKTGRYIRLCVAFFLILALLFVGAGLGLAAIAHTVANSTVSLFRFLPLTLFPFLLPLVAYLANGAMKCYEVPRNNRYIKRAGVMLRSSAIYRIGITGSCGKTSVKQFLAEMLGQRYRVIATPASYNTPIGVARTVFERGTDCDVFLAEMGARRKGDIRDLCNYVAPKYGVLTAVNAQHLLTFGSVEAIAQEKGELIRATARCVVGESAAALARDTDLLEGRDFAAEGIVCTAEGTQFTLRLPCGNYPVKVNLLGKYAAKNLALCAATCYMLGMNGKEIVTAIGRVQQVEHRLQHIQQNGLHILDDSYNSNVDGAYEAIQTLRLFDGSKYAVTPGLVELGTLEEEANKALGKALVGLDGVILVGETLILPVREGYLAAGGDESKLVIVPTLEKASELLSQKVKVGDCVLFLNDLPDCYL